MFWKLALISNSFFAPLFYLFGMKTCRIEEGKNSAILEINLVSYFHLLGDIYMYMINNTLLYNLAEISSVQRLSFFCYCPSSWSIFPAGFGNFVFIPEQYIPFLLVPLFSYYRFFPHLHFYYLKFYNAFKYDFQSIAFQSFI